MENKEHIVDDRVVPVLKKISTLTMIGCIVGFTITSLLFIQMLFLNVYYEQVWVFIKSNHLDKSYYKFFFGKDTNFLTPVILFVTTSIIMAYHLSLKRLLVTKLQSDLMSSLLILKSVFIISIFTFIILLFL